MKVLYELKITVIIFLGIFISCEETTLNQRPNILFIIADDASKISFGAYGNKSVSTPSIDSLANEGVLFTNAYNILKFANQTPDDS